MNFTPSYSPEHRTIITEFLKEKLRITGTAGYAVGLSGGLDSAVTAALAAEAAGKEKVVGMIMPHGENDADAVEDALLVAETFGLGTTTVDISPIADSVKASLDKAPRPGISVWSEENDSETYMRRAQTAWGNVKARSRAILLYYFANHHNCLVAGTGNKSELLLGYFTKFGDGAADVCPIGDLYKTQVYELAGELGVPDGIIRKPPTAGLIDGQTDEGELGLPYSALDRILHGIELRRPENEIARSTGIPLEEVERIMSMVRRSAHKRQPVAIPKIGIRTPGLDWRENIDLAP